MSGIAENDSVIKNSVAPGGYTQKFYYIKVELVASSYQQYTCQGSL